MVIRDINANDSYTKTSLITDDEREQMKINLKCLVPTYKKDSELVTRPIQTRILTRYQQTY
jgi:hypothetical protein